MSRTGTDEAPKTYDQLLMEIPAKYRPKVAETRNAKVRKDRAYEDYLTASREFRALVRALVYRHNLPKMAVARVLELSRTRIEQIIGKR